MSLKVWLPLDGDLRNLGTSDITFIQNTGATVINTGKIGQCYSFDGNDDLLQWQFDKTKYDYKPISVACWFKCDKTKTGDALIDLAADLQVKYTYSSSNGIKFGYWLCYANASGTRVGASGYTSTFYNADVWHHVVVVFEAGKETIYVDGEFSQEIDHTASYTNYWHPLLAASYNKITLAKSTGTPSTAGTNYWAGGLLNDVRIYDHCLSAAEVHEIAQGLVLHYKLDSIEIKNGTNLVTGITTGGQTTLLTDGRLGVQTSGQNADTYFKLNLSENIVKDTTYFLSCDASGIPEGQYWYFPLGSQSNTALSFKIYNGHNEMIFTANDITWTQYGDLKLMLDDIRAFYGPTQFYNFQLIKLSASNAQLEIKDSSGYSHHAVLTNGAQATNTSRYTSSLALTASTKAIGNPIFEAGVFIPEYTWCGWIKRNYTTAAAKQIHANIATISLYTDFTPYISWTSGKTDGSTTGNGAAGGSAATILDEWDHMAITYKSGIGKFYINGELIKTWNYTNQGVYIVAAENNILGNGFIGNLSDIRIYVTELLDTDIKLLYNVGMRVDNLGGIHTFEFLENEEKESIKKTGQVITKTLDESHSIAQQSKNYGWFSPNFIEI